MNNIKKFIKSKIKYILTNKLKIDIWNDNGRTREAWIAKTIAQIPSGNSILDAGAGELQFKELCSHLNYTSQDLGQYDGVGNLEGLHTKKWDNSKLDIVSDITKIPVKDSSFDSILCTEVFEHISEPAKAIKEFSRIIKPGGTLIITAPFCSLTHFAPFYFANGYSKYWYEKILDENGFMIKEMDFNGNFFSYLAQEIRRIPIIIDTCHKADITTIRKITRAILGFFLKLTMGVMFILLYFFSKDDSNSHEILCFGIHVVAVKK